MDLPPLIRGRFLRRYKRFFVEIETDSGGILVAHCPNTGSMRGLGKPGSAAWVSSSDNPRRKLAYTLELVEADGIPVSVNTLRTNHVVEEALAQGRIPPFAECVSWKREARFDKVRFDFRLETSPPHFVEVKSVTLAEEGTGLFPDAVTDRGKRHIEHLIEAKRQGFGAAVIYAAMRSDISEVRPAAHIDPAYNAAMERAIEAGVTFLACRFRVTPKALAFDRILPVHPARRPS